MDWVTHFWYLLMICQATSSFSLMPKGGSTTSSVSVAQEVWDQLVRLHSWWGRWRFSSILWGRTEILNAKEPVHVWSCNVQCLPHCIPRFLKSRVATWQFNTIYYNLQNWGPSPIFGQPIPGCCPCSCPQSRFILSVLLPIRAQTIAQPKRSQLSCD